jgi:hypothetical protein
MNQISKFCQQLLIAIFAMTVAIGDDREAHWSFQQLQKPDAPEVKNEFWVRNEIDRFVVAKLEAEGLKPVVEADKITLIRRLTLDLTGLPPTIAEIDAFLADKSENAYEKLVDQLLDSPHYGERWGRHWLDVARYVQGEIKVPGVNKIDMAEPFRDYVIRSLNADKPFDRFVTEQLAGDLLPEAPDGNFDQLIAPAFLSIGPWFDECPDPNTLRMDIIDEQISAVSQAFLGLNFGCARCHDHKFDPIPTKDYYALAGIFGSTRIIGAMNENWRDGRLRLTQRLASEEATKEADLRSQAAERLRGERFRILEKERRQLLSQLEAKMPAYEVVARSLPAPVTIKIEAEDYHGQNNVRRVTVGRMKVVETQIPTKQWLRFHPKAPEAGTYSIYLRYATSEPLPIELRLNGKTVREAEAVAATGGWSAEHFRWEKLGSFNLNEGSNDLRVWAKEHTKFPRIDQILWVLEDPDRARKIDAAVAKMGLRAEIVEAVHLGHWPPSIAGSERFIQDSIDLLTFDALIQSEAKAAPEFESILAVSDADWPADKPIHIKGEVYEIRDRPVPRAVPSLAASFVDSPRIPSKVSGRLQLAEWIVDPENPLTARVIANRLWQGHFGRGIVATPGDLGVQGAEPTNQQLLDWLAATLIEEGWSLKALHRRIVSSTTYRLSSESNAANAEVDPDNRLHWRYPRHRLEAETIYDSMLTAIGKVARQPSGQTLDNSKSKDRALYILTSSRSPLGLGLEIRKMLHLFGYDPSGVPVHQRDQSTIAEQQLFWLNNPLPRFYANKLAERLLAESDLDDRQRIELAFRITVSRSPEPGATLAYLKFCRDELKLDEPEAWTRVCLGIFSSDSFSYLE